MNQDTHSSRRRPFLLEIGSEEIPARFIPAAMDEFETRMAAGLETSRLQAEGLRVVATPRRMALLIEALDEVQPERETELKGPPVSVAFAADGSPTPAGLGFARKAGIDLADCGRGKDQRGEHLLVSRREPGRTAAEVLAELVPQVVLGVPFRKVMRWGDYDLEYPRPLQWLVALLGEDVVDLRVGHVRSGRVSRGHRTLAANAGIEIAAADQYLKVLEEAAVIVDHQRRRILIEQGLHRELERWNPEAALLPDDGLLTEVTFLCEHPRPFLGTFDAEFSALPDRVVTTALKAHQRYFSVVGADGRLLPRFAAVRDGGEDFLADVVAGNERVLRARLSDALFYWTFDQKKTPDERTAMLGSVTWLEGFGSVLDKTRRLEVLVPWVWEAGLGGDAPVPDALRRAATLCKGDLVSEMIKDGKEFTKLEGFIGARYAELAGEAPAVCTAVKDHYLPRSAVGELPSDALSAALALADRLDTVAGCWLGGFVPTGAKDPYALRRQVLGMLRILLDRGVSFDLDEALDRAWESMIERAPERATAAVRAELKTFVRTRLAGYCTDTLGCSGAVVRAVLPLRGADPKAAVAWIRALEGFRDREDFLQLARGFKRCRNILQGEVLASGDLDSCLARWLDGGRGADGEDLSRLIEPAESELRVQVAAAAPGLQQAEQDGAHGEIFAILSSIGPSIDAFFDQVMVNVEDADLRAVRHVFLREVHGLFARYADFAEVAPQD